MNPLSITSVITYPEFRNLNFKLLYRKTWMIVISVLAILLIAFSLVAYFIHYDAFFDSWFFSIGLGITWAAVFVPIAGFFGTRTRYKSNKALQQPMTYEFSEEGVNITSDLFSTQFKWQKLHKIELVDGWLLLYQSKAAANFVKFDSSDKIELEELKKFLKIEGPKAKVYAAKPI